MLDAGLFRTYIKPMENAGGKYEWDENKREANRAKHGVDFAAVAGFVWSTALVRRDLRQEETRYAAMGLINGRLHALVFTLRGDAVRVISLRKANDREKELYNDAKA